jgi:hypothetical protein
MHGPYNCRQMHSAISYVALQIVYRRIRNFCFLVCTATRVSVCSVAWPTLGGSSLSPMARNAIFVRRICT